MNNKSLFEQAAGKILSANQLEGVMKLHTALFENQSPEQMAENVADAVKNAVDDSVETAANEQVIQDVATAPSMMSLEDQQDLKALVDNMSDTEKESFLESLDDQQVQILAEGVGNAWQWFKNLFSKAGRSANRVNKYGNLAAKDAALSAQLDKTMNINPNLVSNKIANKLDKLYNKRTQIRQNMEDLRAKASTRGGTEFDEMTNLGLKNGSRNFQVKEMENMRANLQNQWQTEFNKAQMEYDAEMDRIAKRAASNSLKESSVQAQKRNAANKFKAAIDEANAKYSNQINDINSRIRMANQEARYAQQANAGFNNGFGGFGFNNGLRGTESPFAQRLQRDKMFKQMGRNGGMFIDQFGRPFYGNFGRIGGLGSLLDKFPILGTINKLRIGAWAGLKLAAVGALGYGGYKVWDFFSKPEELDVKLGNGDGATIDNVKKVLYVLGGGAAGNIGARFLGFDSTTGKTVGTLLGAALVAYFMYLNGGDEEAATELLDTYNNASPIDQAAINEALDIPGFADLLKKMFDASDAA